MSGLSRTAQVLGRPGRRSGDEGSREGAERLCRGWDGCDSPSGWVSLLGLLLQGLFLSLSVSAFGLFVAEQLQPTWRWQAEPKVVGWNPSLGSLGREQILTSVT